MKEYYTAKEVGAALRVTPQTIKLWALSGKIPCLRLTPKTLRFDMDAVSEALAAIGDDKTAGTGSQ